MLRASWRDAAEQCRCAAANDAKEACQAFDHEREAPVAREPPHYRSTPRAMKLCCKSVARHHMNIGWQTAVKESYKIRRHVRRREESIKFDGTSQGTRVATAICSQDPWLKDPPGGPGSCHNINAQATVNAGEIPDVLISKVFYLARSVSLDEAQALSKAHPSGPPPAPPPMPTNPPGKAADRHSGSIGATGPAAAGPGAAPISFPAEDLVSAGKVHVSQGKVMVQTMSAFGPGWGNNAQLLWGEAGVGAVLDMTVDIAIPGTYALQMSMTRAPDYATVSIEVDGKPGPEFVGWAPSVMPPWPFSAGTFPLLPGARKVTLRIPGRAPRRRGISSASTISC